MVDTNTKIAGTSRLFRARFYDSGEDTKASLTTTLSASNSNLELLAKQAGIMGNDISLKYIDSGLEDTDLAVAVENDTDIEVTLERKQSYASYVTTNTDGESNISFKSAQAATSANTISIKLVTATTATIGIASVAIASKVVTVTCSGNHGLLVGDVVGISGIASLAIVNGCFQIHTQAAANTFAFSILDAQTETAATGFGIVSKLEITVATKDITIKSPVDTAGNPIATPSAIVLLWGRTAAAKALASCKITGTLGNKAVGFISKRYLTGGKTSAIMTTALDVKREIDKHVTAKELVETFIPQNTTGTGVVSAMDKTFLTGGSNLLLADPDNQEVNVFVYDAYENVVGTSDAAYILAHPELVIDLISVVTRESLGVYKCVYSPPDYCRTIYIEFKAELNGYTVKNRYRINLDWALSTT